jgi:hypothetical protein
MPRDRNPQPLQTDSQLVEAARNLEQLPSFFGSFLTQTTKSLSSDPLVLSLALGSVSLGLVTRKVTVSQAFFWSTYALLRTIASIGNAIVAHAQVEAQIAAQQAAPPVREPPVSGTPMGEIFDIQPSPQQ